MLSTVVMTVMVELLCLITPQNQSAYAQLSLEKQAVAGARQTLASALDANLPKITLFDWFETVVGRKAGMVWQLSECGDTEANSARDSPACVEVNSLLPDGRKVIIMIGVGTFKQGIAGNPFFHYGVVEERGRLRPIKRLGDLQNILSKPLGELALRPPVVLPQVNTFNVKFESNNAYRSILAPWNVEGIGWLTELEETPPAPPTDRPQNSPPLPDKPIQLVADRDLKLNAIIRVEPVYPAPARIMKATGTVSVQITVSEMGKVIDAKAISGHNALRPAAVDAAYKWVFKPTTVDGTPIKVQGILLFNFK